MTVVPAKTPRDSTVEARYLVMPQHANDLGIAFGGTLMSWIDMVAARKELLQILRLQTPSETSQ